MLSLDESAAIFCTLQTPISNYECPLCGEVTRNYSFGSCLVP